MPRWPLAWSGIYSTRLFLPPFLPSDAHTHHLFGRPGHAAFRVRRLWNDLVSDLSDSVLPPVNVMTRPRDLLAHLKLPPEALILSALYRVGFNSAFRIVIMLGFSLPAASFSPIGFANFLVLFPITAPRGRSTRV